jgi:hypothetical protein
MRICGTRRDVVLFNAPSETDDATAVWIPDDAILYGSCAFIKSCPNAGSPFRVLRDPMRWAATLEQFLALHPRTLIPEFGAPLTDAKDINEALSVTIRSLHYLRREVGALRAQLRVREVYGIPEEVASDAGETVNVFQALLSLELMSAFFLRDFLAAFAHRADAPSNWLTALQQLAMDGLREGLQNRMPLTWSDRDSKVANITCWTVTPSQPQGSARMAGAILDFWSYDAVAISERLQRHERGLQPHLFERPVLKFGSLLVQLPWIVGMQNNSTAANQQPSAPWCAARPGEGGDAAHRSRFGAAARVTRFQRGAELEAATGCRRPWRGGRDRRTRRPLVCAGGEIDVPAALAEGCMASCQHDLAQGRHSVAPQGGRDFPSDRRGPRVQGHAGLVRGAEPVSLPWLDRRHIH